MIKHIPSQNKFELEINGAISFIKYYEKNGAYILWHSEVPTHLRGQGIGKQLVEATFEYLVQNNIKAHATCSYIRMIAMRNPKWKNHITY